ncbi:hypothetical protein GCM10029978_067610 [Actinoallomurus acanthiterrae]
MPTPDRSAARMTSARTALAVDLVAVDLVVSGLPWPPRGLRAILREVEAIARALGAELSAALVVVGTVVLMMATAVGVVLRRVQLAARRLEGVRQALREADKRAQHSMELRDLWEATSSRLQLYHETVTTQAKVSFYTALLASLFGFVLLVGCALLLAFKTPHNDTVNIVTGVLVASSAAFAGYIGRTFVRSQEASAAHLRAYFDQPVELFRYLAAERLLEGIDPAQRTAVVADLARAIVAPTAPSADITATSVDRHRPWWRRRKRSTDAKTST